MSKNEQNQTTVKAVRMECQIAEIFDQIIKNDFSSANEFIKESIHLYKIEKYRGTSPTIETDIDNFRAHLNGMLEMYSHLLHLNNDSELRIRDKFKDILEQKDSEYDNLKDKYEKIQESLKLYKDNCAEAEKDLQKLESQIEQLQKNLSDKNTIISAYTSQISSLQDDLSRLEVSFEKINKEKEEFEHAHKDYEDIKEKNIKLTSEVENLKSYYENELQKQKQRLEFEQEKILLEKEKEKQKELSDLKEFYLQKIQETLLNKNYTNNENDKKKDQ